VTIFVRLLTCDRNKIWSGPPNGLDPKVVWSGPKMRVEINASAVDASMEHVHRRIQGGHDPPKLSPNNFQEKPSSAFRMQENPLVAGGAYSAPPDSLAGGWKGASCPLTRTQRPLSALCGHRSSLTRSTQPCIPPGSLNRVPASAGVKAGISPV